MGRLAGASGGAVGEAERPKPPGVVRCSRPKGPDALPLTYRED